MGRHKKPVAKHLRDGTYRHDRHGDSADKKFPAGKPEPPRGMKPEARKLWRLFVDTVPPECQSRLDAAALELLCSTWMNWKRFQSDLEAETAPDVACRLHRAASRAAEQFAHLAGRFGFSPGDRTRMKIPLIAEQEPESPLDKLRRIIGQA